MSSTHTADFNLAGDALLLFFVLFLLDNLWSEYGPARMLLETRNLPSVPAKEMSQDIYTPYVFSDIATSFTLLVGIYFPSVTGKQANILKRHFRYL